MEGSSNLKSMFNCYFLFIIIIFKKYILSLQLFFLPSSLVILLSIEPTVFP